MTMILRSFPHRVNLKVENIFFLKQCYLSQPEDGLLPGKQVQHLLLAAGDGGEGLNDGTGCLPRCLGGWGEQHLGDRGDDS